ncbi:hypothetical protein EVAR_78310_1 [Eumeta japonica]|uniref:Uncharacterized protein n=1 Tax=Eumeta variegata TaxID=151549 RepID=A0A4C1T429_EUMVA|nr:hypothetical protein EVAR_78310_1 [Eumeta japonica]
MKFKRKRGREGDEKVHHAYRSIPLTGGARTCRPAAGRPRAGRGHVADYRGDVTAIKVAFHPVNENLGGPLSPQSPPSPYHRPTLLSIRYSIRYQKAGNALKNGGSNHLLFNGSHARSPLRNAIKIPFSQF